MPRPEPPERPRRKCAETAPLHGRACRSNGGSRGEGTRGEEGGAAGEQAGCVGGGDDGGQQRHDIDPGRGGEGFSHLALQLGEQAARHVGGLQRDAPREGGGEVGLCPGDACFGNGVVPAPRKRREASLPAPAFCSHARNAACEQNAWERERERGGGRGGTRMSSLPKPRRTYAASPEKRSCHEPFAGLDTRCHVSLRDLRFQTRVRRSEQSGWTRSLRREG